MQDEEQYVTKDTGNFKSEMESRGINLVNQVSISRSVNYEDGSSVWNAYDAFDGDSIPINGTDRWQNLDELIEALQVNGYTSTMDKKEQHDYCTNLSRLATRMCPQDFENPYTYELSSATNYREWPDGRRSMGLLDDRDIYYGTMSFDPESNEWRFKNQDISLSITRETAIEIDSQYASLFNEKTEDLGPSRDAAIASRMAQLGSMEM